MTVTTRPRRNHPRRPPKRRLSPPHRSRLRPQRPRRLRRPKRPRRPWSCPRPVAAWPRCRRVARCAAACATRCRGSTS
ncbi:MAG: hypothetical protein F4062_01865 [Acidimicrobiia bacterium]|nr:hypothetical protein [Acidimicrobiia bacterium]